MTELSFSQISFLTFQAIVQVIIVCLAGFWSSKIGLLNKDGEKLISILNVYIFTPSLIFTKLSKSLSITKLIEIIIIPIFYIISTLISFIISKIISYNLNLDQDEGNFVCAMSVFGNSNSLPVSLTIALSYTLPNLKWNDIIDDDSDKIAARGILYLLIFQQIGQVLRWSWGYNTLLKRKPQIILNSTIDVENEASGYGNEASGYGNVDADNDDDDSKYNVNSSNSSTDHLLSSGVINNDHNNDNNDNEINESIWKKFLNKIGKIFNKFKSIMNPPLYSMIASVIVASIPSIKNEFYQNDGFIQNTISESIKQLGSVSIPLILIVLGSNLYPSNDIPSASSNYKKIVFGSLISRMILPPLILLPIITIIVKNFKISIIDDPIFLIVCFILTISPPAIQLSQICQLNEIFEKEMAGVLFWGYVVLTLPTTIITVSAALRVLEWAIDDNN